MSLRKSAPTTLLLCACLAATAAAQLTIATDAAVYTVGDPVTITIHNAGAEPIEFWGQPPYGIYHEDDEVAINTSLPVGWTLPAGATDVSVHHTGAVPDLLGVFHVHLGNVSEHPDSILSASFVVEPVVTALPRSLSLVKALFR